MDDPQPTVDIPAAKALAAEHGYNLVTSSLLPPGYAGFIFNPPPAPWWMPDDLQTQPTVILAAAPEEVRSDG